MFKNIFLRLLFINIVFCYDYSEATPGRPRMRYHGDRADDSEVANIDLAGLIQGDEPSEVGADSRDDSSNNNFDSLVETNLEEYQGNEDYLNKDDDSIFNEQPPSYRNDRSLAGTKNNDEESRNKFITQDNYKNLQNKCSFKYMKIPFFSHDKRKSTQTKKNRKRKLFNFIAKKQKKKILSTSLSSTTQRSTETTLFKLKKRSYLERICPICKRKFNNGEQANQITHNSRQYYYKKSFENNDSGTKNVDKNDEPPSRERTSHEAIESR